MKQFMMWEDMVTRGGGPVNARLDPRDNYPPCNKQRPISQEFLRVSGRKGRASLRTMRFPFFAAGKRVRTSILDIGECKAALSAPVLGFLFCRWTPVPISPDRGEGDRYPLTSQQCQAHLRVMYGLIQWLWLVVHGGSGSDKAEMAGAYP